MRKVCNFILPKPFVIQSPSKGLKKNGYRIYFIYPDLSKFKKACLNCPHILHKDKRYSCRIDDPDFKLRFYGIMDNLPKGVYLKIGGVPLSLQACSIAMEIKSYLSKHSRRPIKSRKVRTKNKNSDGSKERLSAFPVQSKQGAR